ncbi:MAG TPA: NAD-dependent epimerase/dehydratase family protein [Methanomicrobiales archaeon]|nr:NAD-dependent epimerase/dehydratase family protein [Methanomicrobiales archaeon]
MVFTHYLITGGAGFIGSHVARHLLEQGGRVTIVDNLSTGRQENIPEGARFIHLDLTDESFPADLDGKGIDAIIHLAAQSSGEISFERPAYDLKTNTLGTLLLLRWSLENRIQKFVYSSSMSVYGDGPEWPVTEEGPINPKSFYGVGKMASEHYINIFHDMGLDTTILRFFNVYGPGQNMENLKQGMVSIYMSYIAGGRPILVKGALDRFRDLVYIDDVVRAIDLSLERRESSGMTFNVCTGRKTSISQLLEMIMTSFGESRDYPLMLAPPTPRDQHGVFGSYERIRGVLDWSPAVSLEEGLTRMTSWVKEYYARKG